MMPVPFLRLLLAAQHALVHLCVCECVVCECPNHSYTCHAHPDTPRHTCRLQTHPTHTHKNSVNAFGDSDTFDFSDIVMSWDDCIAELEARKAATHQPDMKMIISMSLGAGGDLAVVRNTVKKIVSERNDILFLSAAGNGGSSATAYPAGYPEVVSIAAVDWNMNKAHFSQYNSDVEW